MGTTNWCIFCERDQHGNFQEQGVSGKENDHRQEHSQSHHQKGDGEKTGHQGSCKDYGKKTGSKKTGYSTEENSSKEIDCFPRKKGSGALAGTTLPDD